MDNSATQVAGARSISATTGNLFASAELDQFRRDGYFIARRFVADDVRQTMLDVTFAGVRGEIQPIEYEAEVQYPGAPSGVEAEGGRTIRRLKQALSRDPVFTDWVSSPTLVGRLQQLLESRAVMPLAHHNCIMTKHPRFSSDTLWHQDTRYWSYQRPELVSVWLALGREYPENGCLYVIPGTHTQAFSRDRLDDALFLRPELPENEKLIAMKVPVELNPGDVLFFHGRTFHAAGRNRTADTKYSVVFTFRPVDNPPVPGTRSSAFPELILPDCPPEPTA